METPQKKYAFTWSPGPNVAYRYKKPYMQHAECMEILRKIRLCCSSVEIYPELNLNGNIHYHGILVISDMIKWYKSVLPSIKHNGFVCIKQINKEEGWSKYIRKDAETMSGVLEVEIPLTRDSLAKKIRKNCYNALPKGT